MDSGSALANYQNFTSSMQSPDQVLSGQEQQLGVPGEQQQVSGLRQAITNTTNLLQQVAPSVYGRTQNSLVTNAQAGRQIQNESAPIQTKLSGLNTAEGNAASNLNANLSRAQSLASLKSSGQSSQQAALLDLYKTALSSEQNKAQQDEAAREFNASLSAKSSSGSGGLTASESLKQSQAASQTQTVQQIKGALDGVTGRDGYVSPQDYAAAAKDWTQAGYSLNDFKNYFAQYKNPQNPYYSI